MHSSMWVGVSECESRVAQKEGRKKEGVTDHLRKRKKLYSSTRQV